MKLMLMYCWKKLQHFNVFLQFNVFHALCIPFSFIQQCGYHLVARMDVFNFLHFNRIFYLVFALFCKTSDTHFCLHKSSYYLIFTCILQTVHIPSFILTRYFSGSYRTYKIDNKAYKERRTTFFSSLKLFLL